MRAYPNGAAIYLKKVTSLYFGGGTSVIWHVYMYFVGKPFANAGT